MRSGAFHSDTLDCHSELTEESFANEEKADPSSPAAPQDDKLCMAPQDDAFEYPLSQIYFYLTEGCNLHCRHCWIDPPLQTSGRIFPSLPVKHFKEIISQAKPLGLTGVKLTGGEPLLHPDIEKILLKVKKEELGLTVETNAVLCSSGIAAMIAECRDAFVSVSLDGEDAKTHEWIRGVAGCFNQAVQGMSNLVNAGLRPQIIMTVMERNKDQIESVVRLAESLGAGSVKFNILQPIARGERMAEAGGSLSIRELVKMGRWVDNELAATTELKLFFSHPPAFRPLSRIYGDNGNCGVCNIKGILGVLADGSYALCGIGETIPELVFGHVERDRLAGVWEGNPVLKDIRDGLPGCLQGVCAGCLMQTACLGNCVAQNYYSTESLWAPYYYCAEAFEEGQFPETRLKTDAKFQRLATI